MMRLTVVPVLAAALMALPPAAYAETGTFTDPVGDATRRHQGRVITGVSGDSDITHLKVRAVEAEGDDLGVRLRVQVREIDRFSRWRDGAKTGLRLHARFELDNGKSVSFEGDTSSYAWSFSGDCGSGSNPLPNLTFGRYSDMITLDMPGECFAGAESVSVAAKTELFRKRSRLLDRAVSAEPVRFGR